MRVFFIGCALLIIYSGVGKLMASSQTSALAFTPCHVQASSAIIDALCADFIQPENPNDPNGKSLALSVIKLPSFSQSPENDAFVMIQGGPGGSSIDLSVQTVSVLRSIRQHRDVLIMDQRGTGRSQALFCPEENNALEKAVYDLAVVTQTTQQCIDKLKAQDQDLRFYTTSVAVQDIEALRQAAGYQQLTLYGVSYGTRVVQHYLRRYPNSVRGVIIDGVVPIGVSLAGDEVARNAQATLDFLFTRCEKDTDCHAQFAELRIKWQKIRQQFATQSVSITQAHPRTGEINTFSINEDMLLQVVRFMSYHTNSQALIPLLIDKTYRKDYTLLTAQILNIFSQLSESIAGGMHNSVICTEDYPFAEKPNSTISQTYYLQDKLRQQISAACQIWPQGVMDEDFTNTFSSDTPVLILSGQTDPVTPPRYGEMAHNMFANSAHIITPSHGHGVFATGCLPNIFSEFVQDLDLGLANSECVKREKAMPFFMNNAGPTP